MQGNNGHKLDLAARAAWLYFVGNNTQDEIAAKLGVSRQAAQRLVSLAVSEKLIAHRLNHPLAEVVELAERLRDRFGLTYCDVAPSDPDPRDANASVGAWGAGYLESFLTAKAPTIVALSAGRTLRALVSNVAPMNQPQHKIVALQGHIAHDGRASHYEVVMYLADRVNAQAYPLSTPVIARSAQDRDYLQQQPSFLAVRALVSAAKVAFVGIGDIAWDERLQRNGNEFQYAILSNETMLAELIEQGAVGAILGLAYDREGRVVSASSNDRVAGMSLQDLPGGHTVGVACGLNKVVAIGAALRGKLISGLITDETTARAILEAA